MENQWNDFTDFELMCLCQDYGFEGSIEIESIFPVKLKNRKAVEELLTAIEFEMAFGE